MESAGGKHREHYTAISGGNLRYISPKIGVKILQGVHHGTGKGSLDQQDHAGAERDGCKDGEPGVLLCGWTEAQGKEKAQVNKKSPERFAKNVRAFCYL